jgi:hypothetical protein
MFFNDNHSLVTLEGDAYYDTKTCYSDRVRAVLVCHSKEPGKPDDHHFFFLLLEPAGHALSYRRIGLFMSKQLRLSASEMHPLHVDGLVERIVLI